MRTSVHRRGLLLAGLAGCLDRRCWAQSGAQAGGRDEIDRSLASERFNIIAPFPPGGPVDMLARMLADGLHQRYEQVAVVENLPGAAGNLGMDRVRRAKPDGHALLVVPAGNLTINPALMTKFPFNIDKDFAPVTMLAQAPNVLVASPALHLSNLGELLALARAKPGTLSYASPGVGSGLHLAGELFKLNSGVDIQHVPYKGTQQALNDVAGGAIGLMFTNLPAALEYIRRGRVVALGVTERRRTPVAPDIATFAEQGVAGVVVTSWYGLLAPAATPPELLDRLAAVSAGVLAQPAVKSQLQTMGMTALTQSPAQFRALIHTETLEWARIIKARGIFAE